MAQAATLQRKPAAPATARAPESVSARAPIQRKAAAVPPYLQLQRVQLAQAVSQPHDPAEREAEATAKAVIAMAQPVPMLGAGAGLQRAGLGPTNSAPLAASATAAASGSGQPLPQNVRRFMEPRFRANFAAVRIHSDDKAASLNRQLSARAFTVGNDIFFGQGEFQPESQSGMELIAHELAHTIQQGATPQARDAAPAVTQAAPRRLQRFGISDVLDYFADKANNIPGFRMLTILLGFNPINMSDVDRSGANILRALIEFLPGGKLITDALEKYGVFAKAGAWIDTQFKALGNIGAAIRNAISEFIDSLGWRDIFHLGDVWDRAKRIFTEPIDRIIDFGKGLVDGIIALIKDAILMPLAKLAEGTRGWDLLCAVLGKNPITGEKVAQSAENLVGGFMKFIGQEEVWKRIQETGAISKVWAWFKSALATLIDFVSQLPALALAAFRSLELSDIIVLPRAIIKIVSVFGNFATRFVNWALEAVWKLLEIVFSVVSPGAWGHIQRAGAALKSILKNPFPFVGNLARAAKQGFQKFSERFIVHLQNGLIDWLTGSLPGIYIPKAFSLPEIAKFALSALGLTWANIRAKLVKVIGETAVKVLETGFDIVVTLVRDGPAAAWDKIKEQLTNLKDMVIGGITDFVVETVTQKAIPKLVAMFIPGAGFITAIISIYDMVMVFVRKISAIIQVVTGFIDSITAIAAGAVATAASKVESVLAGLVKLAINFLAGFASIGNIASKLMDVLERVRTPIDKALDKVVDWIVATAKKVGKLVAGVVKSGVARLFDWGKVKAGFTTPSGESHSIYFQGKGPDAKLVLASTPRSLEDVLADEKLKIENREALKRELDEIRKLIAANADIDAKPEPVQVEFQRKVEGMVQQLATKLARFLKLGNLPPSVVTFGGVGGRATYLRAEPLTKNPGNTTGAPAQGRLGTEGDRIVTQFVPKDEHERHDSRGNKIKVSMLPLDQVHLLHYSLHGPFSPQNTALGDKSLNAQMRGAEDGAKNAFDSEKVSYVVAVTYFANAKPTVIDPIPDPVVSTVENWVGYYVAKSITVTSKKAAGDAYSIALPGANASGTLPPVTGKVIEPVDVSALKALRAGIDPTRPSRLFGTTEYVATIYNRETLRTTLGLNLNQMILLAATLTRQGVQIGYGRPPVIFIPKA